MCLKYKTIGNDTVYLPKGLGVCSEGFGLRLDLQEVWNLHWNHLIVQSK